MTGAIPLSVRQTLRRIQHEPGIGAVIVCSLSIGMAAVITLFGIVDTLVLRPPMGVRQPDQVVAIGSWALSDPVAYPDFVDLRENARSFESVGAFALRKYSVKVGTEIISARGWLASQTLLPLLGVVPERGRWFSADEDRPGAERVVIVSVALARRTFGSSAQALGATVFIADQPYTIIGVLPPGVTAPDMSAIDVILPLSNAPTFAGTEALTNRDYQWLRLVARVRSGVSLSQATSEATAIYRHANLSVRSVDQEQLFREKRLVQPIVVARRQVDVRSTRIAVWLTVFASALLAIACVNVGGILLARGVREREEVRILTALGASNWRLVLRPLLEIGTFVLVAFPISLICANRMGEVLTTKLLDARISAPPMDLRTVCTAFALAAAVAICGALWPAISVSKGNALVTSATGKATATSRDRRALKRIMICEVALSVLLVSEAVLFVGSLRRALSVDLGINPHALLIADVDLRAAGLTGSAALAAANRVIERVQDVDGVAFVGMTNAMAVPGFLTLSVTVPGAELAASVSPTEAPSVNAITAGYPEALGLRLRGGRLLTVKEGALQDDEVLISEQFARRYWPQGRALGHCIKVGGPQNVCGQIVGILNDRRQGPMDAGGAADLYVPLGSSLLPQDIASSFPARQIAIRSVGTDPARIRASVRAALIEAVPGLTAVDVQSGDEYLQRDYQVWRLGASVLAVCSALAVGLACVGLFGLWAHIIAQRQRELAVRSALGALPSRLAFLIVKESTFTAAIGVAAGICLAIPVARLTRSLAFDVPPWEMTKYVWASFLMLFVSILAAAWPAMRAGRVSPAESLRGE